MTLGCAWLWAVAWSLAFWLAVAHAAVWLVSLL